MTQEQQTTVQEVDPPHYAAPKESTVLPLERGTKKVQAIVRVMSKEQTWFLYIGIYLLTFVTGLAGALYNLQNFVLSDFYSHSSLPIVMLILSSLRTVMLPMFAKLADLWGRTEILIFSILIWCAGQIVTSKASSYGVVLLAFILVTVGDTGLLAFREFFIADSSTLRNRAIVQGLPDLQYYILIGISGPLLNYFTEKESWRWAYGMFAILIIGTAIPLVSMMLFMEAKIRRLGLIEPINWKANIREYITYVAVKIDLVGCILLTGSLLLVLFPVPWSRSLPDRFSDGRVIAMLVVGCLLWPVLILWEAKYAKFPIVPPKYFAHKTVVGGSLVAFLMWVSYYSYTEMFYAYLMVTQGLDAQDAQYVQSAWQWAGIFAALAVGWSIRRTGQYRRWCHVCTIIAFIGSCMMIAWRGKESKLVEIIIAQTILGLGGGAIMTATQVGVQAAVPSREVAPVTAFYLVMASVGGAVGTAIAGSVWRYKLEHSLIANLPAGTPATVITGIMEDFTWIIKSPTSMAGKLLGPIPDEYLPGIYASYAYVQRILCISAACAIFIAFFVLFMMEPFDLFEKDAIRKAEIDAATAKDAEIAAQRAETGEKTQIDRSSV
ncbi:major facilitator superfamily domain-containing protein [Gaertneriomyces semiglobifer]|nr:major facilitator superfamily domain-containing protein [Gaertneriomyces semiglobifer]